MKKFSTPEFGQVSTTTIKGEKSPSPRAATVNFLRQFARAYRPAPIQALPGIVLN